MTTNEALLIALSTNPLLHGSNGLVDKEYVECIITALQEKILREIDWTCPVCGAQVRRESC